MSQSDCHQIGNSDMYIWICRPWEGNTVVKKVKNLIRLQIVTTHPLGLLFEARSLQRDVI